MRPKNLKSSQILRAHMPYFSQAWSHLLEGETDRFSALSLIKTVHSLETQINRVIRLGRKIKDKHRPLPVSFENMDDKVVVVSRL